MPPFLLPDAPMRLSLLAFLAAVALTSAGCDSNGIDPTPGGGTPGGGTPGGGTPALTFAPVDVTATYLTTDEEAPNATPFLLASYGLRPGDTACFRATGDYLVYPGQLASGTDSPLATGVFSASDRLHGPTERFRVKDPLDTDGDVVTRPMYTSGAATDIPQDFDATDACRVVPAGATHVFLSAVDDMFLDNTDARVGGNGFGVAVSRR